VPAGRITRTVTKTTARRVRAKSGPKSGPKNLAGDFPSSGEGIFSLAIARALADARLGVAMFEARMRAVSASTGATVGTGPTGPVASGGGKAAEEFLGVDPVCI
jgi:hypothetical protein